MNKEVKAIKAPRVIKTNSVALVQYNMKSAGIVSILKLSEENLKVEQAKYKSAIELSKAELKAKLITPLKFAEVEFTNNSALIQAEIDVYSRYLVELNYLTQLITDTLTNEDKFISISEVNLSMVSKTQSKIEVLKEELSTVVGKYAIEEKVLKAKEQEDIDKASKDLANTLENTVVTDSLFQFGYLFSSQKDHDNFKFYLNRYKKYVFMDLQGKQVISEKYVDSVTGAINWIHRSFKDFREHTRSDIFYAENKSTGFQQKFYFSEEWIETEWMRTQYRQTTFNPDPNFKHGPDLYNFWEGFVEPRKGDVTLFINHINHLIDGTAEEKSYIIKLLAFTIKYPHLVTGLTLALFGEQGCGKSSLSYFLTKICPNHAQFFDDIESVMTGFNGETLAVKFFLWEEAMYGGSKKMENKFKHFVTGQTRSVEIKNVTKMIVPNYAFHVFTSNNEWLVPVDKGDRRNNIFGCTKTLIGNTKYFDELYAWINGEGKHALMYFLLNEVDLSDFNQRATIETDAKVNVKIKSLDYFNSFMMAVLSGDVTEEALDLWNDTERSVERDAFYEAFCIYHPSARMDKREFSNKLSTLLEFSKVSEKWKDNWKTKKEGRSYSYYKLPIIEEARKLFAVSIKETVDTLFNRSLKNGTKADIDYNDLVIEDFKNKSVAYIDKLKNIEIKSDSQFSKAKNALPAKKTTYKLA